MYHWRGTFASVFFQSSPAIDNEQLGLRNIKLDGYLSGYELNEKGVEEKLSSPKRHSFLVGPNEPNHTCQKQFLNLLILRFCWVLAAWSLLQLP